LPEEIMAQPLDQRTGIVKQQCLARGHAPNLTPMTWTTEVQPTV
jgi:hypothetical protein